MAENKNYIALEATSQEIRAIGYNTANRIGDQSNETGGSATEGTVFAKLNNLIEQLTALVTNIGTNTSEETVNEKLDEIINSVSTSTGVIRHIQRGNVITSSANDHGGTVTLAGFTDLEKMVVILNGDKYSGSGVYSAVYLDKLTLTSLSVQGERGGSYSYQVIEFC